MSKGFYGYLLGVKSVAEDMKLPKHESLEEHRKHCKAEEGNCPFDKNVKSESDKASKEDIVDAASDKPYGDMDESTYKEHIPHGVDLVGNLMCHIYKDGTISLNESGEYHTGYIDVGGEKDSLELAKEIVEKYARSANGKAYSAEEWEKHFASGFYDSRISMVADMIEKARQVINAVTEKPNDSDYEKYELGNGIHAFAEYMKSHPDGLTEEQKRHAENLVSYGSQEHEYASNVAPWFAQHSGNLNDEQKKAVDQLVLINNISRGEGWEHDDKWGISDDEIAEYADIFKAADEGVFKKAKGMPDYIDSIGKCKAMILSRLEDCNFHSECSLLEKGKYDELMRLYN